MEIYFKFYKEPYFNQDKKQEIKEKLNEIFEISLNDSDLLTRPSIYIDKLKDKDKMRSFLDYFKELVKGLQVIVIYNKMESAYTADSIFYIYLSLFTF